MYYKEEIEITKEDEVIITKLGELLSMSQIDNCFFVHDQEFFTQLEVFPDGFTEAYTKGFTRFFSDKWYYRWVRNNSICKFTSLLEALFKGLLDRFDEDEVGNLTYKNCRAYRTYHIVTQSEEQAETTQEVNSKILELDEVRLYENGMLEFEDNVVQVLECFHIKTESIESADKVDSKKKKKELIREIRTMIYQRMCDLLEANFKRANCVEVIQYRLILGILIGVIDKEFKPIFKEECYSMFQVAKNVTVSMESEFKCFKARYVDFKHYKKSLIKL